MKKNPSKTKYLFLFVLILSVYIPLKIRWMPSQATSAKIALTASNSEAQDPYSDTQWAFQNHGSYQKLFGPSKIEMPARAGIDLGLTKAFSIYNSKLCHTEEVICAVIDTGVDYLHPDLIDNMWQNKSEIPGDGIDNDNNGYIDDIYGWNFYDDSPTICHYRKTHAADGSSSLPENCDDHGTHCAGIIAAKANNGIGIAGVASNVNVKIMSLKIHGGPNGTGTVSDAIRAIKYAEQMGAKVCNLSWGFSTDNKTLREIMSRSSMLFVCAAGNSGNCNDTVPLYPAGYALKNVISVTFFTPYGELPKNANYGKLSVDMAAPGIDILSTSVGSYQTLKGSSMATAYVSGLACMLYSFNSNTSPENIKKVIIKSMTPDSFLDGYVRYPGIPNAVKMIENSNLLIPDGTPPTITINSHFVKDIIELNVNALDQDSGIRVISYLPQKRTLADFKKGTTGIIITKPTINLAKTGTYTFYASDYAGNETCLTYQVQEDLVPPVINALYYPCVGSTDLLLSINARDEQSGIRQLKYLPGKKEVDAFKSGNLGTALTLKNGTAAVIAPKSDCYTFYAIDNRGNKIVYLLETKTTPITSLSFEKKSIETTLGSREKIKYYYEPQKTSDSLYFTSSDPRIVSVSQTGTIHAKEKGSAIITIHSYSGLTKKIKVTVK